jgi:hypothetical protein
MPNRADDSPLQNGLQDLEDAPNTGGEYSSPSPAIRAALSKPQGVLWRVSLGSMLIQEDQALYAALI